MQNLITDQEYQLYRLFASWTKKQKYEHIQKLSPLAAWRLKYTWAAWARDSQLPPSGNWSTWLIQAGRGFGKTRTGAEYIISQAQAYPCCHIALVGRTVADVRDVMIKGRSGILSVSPPWFMPKYEPSKRLITWPNGTHATTYSADEPDQLRGPQHSLAWCDELASWMYPDAWDQLQFGLRIPPCKGVEPLAVATTTPRNTKAMHALAKDPSTVVTRGHTRENAENLSPRFLKEIERIYGGTRLGRQEIAGDLLEDIDGALWKRAWIEDNRVRQRPNRLKRIVVGVDPPATSLETSDDPAECGIVVVGEGFDGHGYVLADCSLIGTPEEWGSAVIAAYDQFEADVVVGEVNNGGEMIGFVIRTVAKKKGIGRLPYRAVRATRGKQMRAEPISTMYQQNQWHHVGGFPMLEDQQCSWVPGEKSPDRLDGLVWAGTELFGKGDKVGGMIVLSDDEYEQEESVWQ